MKLQEIDPNKKYLLLVQTSFASPADLNAIVVAHKQVLTKHGIENVLVGTDVVTDTTYFGLYCEQCGVWLRTQKHHKPWVLEQGKIIFYPAAAIAQAELNEINSIRGRSVPEHLWKVTEFGTEQHYVTLEELPAGETLCPVAISGKSSAPQW